MRSKIVSKIYNETPESTKQKIRGMANAIVFDANTFGPDEVPVEQVLNGEYTGYSTDVLIDIDGDRKHFAIGYYLFDRDGDEWITYELKTKIGPGMRWSFLPLAIYDTNPELRKTVKI